MTAAVFLLRYRKASVTQPPISAPTRQLRTRERQALPVRYLLRTALRPANQPLERAVSAKTATVNSSNNGRVTGLPMAIARHERGPKKGMFIIDNMESLLSGSEIAFAIEVAAGF